MNNREKSWKYNIRNDAEQMDFDCITFKEINGIWQVYGYGFTESANPATYGGYNTYNILFENFLKTKPELLPDEIYEEMKTIIRNLKDN